MPGDLSEHTLIAAVGNCASELLDQAGRLDGLGDAATVDLLAFAALLQAHTGLVHRLQHQARDGCHLRGLIEELAALLALGLFQGVGAVISQAGLEHVEVVGHA
ncbi:hypothetical protein PS623_03283 [Pseudomonas fluorescens]|nr:hypothetical protein PS623_03283 [Pseudomonas fluorescens]